MEAFALNDSLELEERAGLALKEYARVAKIRYDQNVMPYIWTWYDESTAYRFCYSDGPSVDMDMLATYEEKYPEYAPTAKKLLQYARTFCEESAPLVSDRHNRLAASEAEWAGTWGGHGNPDFGKIINLGTEGIRKQIDECKQACPDKDWFYRGCEYAMDALDILGDRFCRLALDEAEKCDDPKQKARFEAAARAFEVVPRKPAYDFESACLVFWMTFTFDGDDSPGRLDQYMYRAYSVTENREDADEALYRLWEVMHNERAWNLCLSGSDEDWNDQTNELTYKILELAREKRYHTPNITLRVHCNTPEELWQAIAETQATGIGMPALYNDEVVCTALEKMGIPPCDSHLYCMNGCNQIDIMGKSHMGLEDGEVLFCKCLEYALYNGVNPLTGTDDSIHTGDPMEFDTYEKLENAFLRQLDYVTYVCCEAANVYQHWRGVYSPNPFRSCLVEGCLEKGRDYRNGGPLYGHGQILAEGIADTGDSLWAIKRFIYEEKKYTMEQLINALDADFEGYEEMRHDLMNCEKFGNNCQCVDSITAKILNRFFAVLKRNNTYRGGVFAGGCSTFNRAADRGRVVGALPNGRKSRDTLLADCIGAVPGNDRNGPTALINSVLGYDQTESGSGFVFQTKYDKKIISTEKGKQTLIALAKTYFAGGGQQFTVNVVDPQDLIDAQKDPDNHRDLIVRVGGYSDIFVNLEKGLQDNIIARTNIEV